MSYTYLLDLYKEIEERSSQASKVTGSAGEGKSKAFQQGRIEILQEFRVFLAENYNKKLPRRIRNTYR